MNTFCNYCAYLTPNELCPCGIPGWPRGQRASQQAQLGGIGDAYMPLPVSAGGCTHTRSMLLLMTSMIPCICRALRAVALRVWQDAYIQKGATRYVPGSYSSPPPDGPVPTNVLGWAKGRGRMESAGARGPSVRRRLAGVMYLCAVRTKYQARASERKVMGKATRQSLEGVRPPTVGSGWCSR